MSTGSIEAEVTALGGPIEGAVLAPGDEGYQHEIAPFNTAVVHTPDVVIAAASAADVAAAVRFAAAQGLPIAVQSTGHREDAVTSGVLVSTRRLGGVRIDPDARIATAGAGARWSDVIAAAAGHGLAPIAGASGNVGVVGLLLGGGLGPLARSHGFSSDRLVGATVVTGAGEVLEVDADRHPDLLWALRGGKDGLGIVTEVRVQLVALPTLFGGSLFFAEDQIEPAFRAWADWTADADPQVTTSTAIIRFPPFDMVPEPLRGRRLLTIRFAYPGDRAEGERLAAPLRAFAPVHLDLLGELPAEQIARIHNDPTQPSPAWVSGALLTGIDQDLATAYLAAAEASPFLSVELRHLGEATTRDVPEGSAVGGRSGAFVLSLVAADPSQFGTLPAATDRLLAAIAGRVSPANTPNFMGTPRSEAHRASAWPPETYARLAEIGRRYDPEGVRAA
jgi:hypothetical protein